MGLVVPFVKDLDAKLLRLSPRDVFTCRDACGVHIFGSPGSGKSSGPGRMIAGAYLRAGMGGLVTAGKFDEVGVWRDDYAPKHGRARSIVLFDENEGFNFLQYLMAQQGFEGIGTVTETMMRIIDMSRRASGAASTKGGESFWEDGARMGLRGALPLLYSAHGSLSIPEIIRFISTAPANPKEPADKDWQERSYMFSVLKKAIHNPRVPMPKDALLSLVNSFWAERWPAIPSRTLGNIVISITAALDRFNCGRLNRVFCGKTTIVPELSFGGAVIVLAMPTLTWNEDGVIAQQLFKYLWQRAVLRRSSLDTRHKERFIFLWSDESQETVNSYDGEFLSLSRQSKCCVTYLSQSLPSYVAKIRGDTPKEDAEGLVGKFVTHIYHSNACATTNEYAARVLGRVMTRRGSYSAGSSESINYGMSAGNSENSGFSSNSGSSHGGQNNYSLNSGSGQSSGSGSNWGANRGRGTTRNESRGYSESLEYSVEPGDFGRMLRTGGTRNGNEVTGVWYQAGRVFEASGTNWLKVRFKQ